MTNPNPNSSLTPLYIGQSFTGAWQSTGTSVGISANLNTDSLSLLTIQQSNFSNGAFIDNTQTSSYQPGVAETYQMPVVLKYFRVILQNADIIDQTFCRLNTVLTSSISHDIDIRKLSAFADADNIEIIAKDGTGTLRHVLCDANGALVTTPSAVAQDVNVLSMPAITGTVAVSSQPHLSYLTDNVAVSTMPAITGTVAVSSQPHLSYLTDNVAVATMPAITGTVAVSSQPHLSYLTDNVAVATQPALAFSTDKVDVSGSSVSVSTLPSIPAGSNTIGNVYSYEAPADVANLTGVSIIGQTIKNTAGSLMNLTVFNDGNAISYVKIYNVAVPTSADTPVLILPVLHDSPINTLSMHNIQFTTAIGIRATANYIASDNNAPNGTTSVVAFYNGVAP